jgi:hypothetical protein
MRNYACRLVAMGLLFGSSAGSWGATNEDLERRLELLEKELRRTQAELKQLSSERAAPAPAPVSAPAPEYVPAPAHSGGKTVVEPWEEAGALDASFGSGGTHWSDRTSIGGYGEMHLNLGDKEQIDFHRWVLYLSHQFTDKVTFFTELELEHSLAKDTDDGSNAGEVELEQAYIDFALGENTNVRVGQMLLPLGLINETHEPDTFFGVERNNVEKNVIPATWWEGGVAAQQRFENGLSVDAMFHSGLNVPDSGSNAFRIRSGRQKVSEADASEWAATARARYQGITGLDVSAFLQYQSDLSPLNAEDNAALLSGGTVSYQRGGFGVRGLIAHWDIDGDSFEDAEADSQWGYYLEPSYIWNLPNTDQARLGVFGRFSHYEYAKSSQKEVDEVTAGVNFWPVDNVVLKTDYTHIEEDGKDDNETFNFGVGYSF